MLSIHEFKVAVQAKLRARIPYANIGTNAKIIVSKPKPPLPVEEGSRVGHTTIGANQA